MSSRDNDVVPELIATKNRKDAVLQGRVEPELANRVQRFLDYCSDNDVAMSQSHIVRRAVGKFMDAIERELPQLAAADLDQVGQPAPRDAAAPTQGEHTDAPRAPGRRTRKTTTA